MQGRAWFPSSDHIALVNYLDSMGSLWRLMFTRTRKNARNKEYASLFMEVHGVHKVNWQGWLSLILVINMQYVWTQELGSLSVMLHKPSFVEEGEGTEGSQRWFGRTGGSAILLWVPFVLDHRCCATCWGEILKVFAIGDFERSPPHLFLYLPLFRKNKSGNKKGLYWFWTPGSLNFIESKNEKFF